MCMRDTIQINVCCELVILPGEDPVDVKARLKVWAQAVALASTTRLGS